MSLRFITFVSLLFSLAIPSMAEELTDTRLQFSSTIGANVSHDVQLESAALQFSNLPEGEVVAATLGWHVAPDPALVEVWAHIFFTEARYCILPGELADCHAEWGAMFAAMVNRHNDPTRWRGTFWQVIHAGCSDPSRLCEINGLERRFGPQAQASPHGQAALAYAEQLVSAWTNGTFEGPTDIHSWVMPGSETSWFRRNCLKFQLEHRFYGDCLSTDVPVSLVPVPRPARPAIVAEYHPS